MGLKGLLQCLVQLLICMQSREGKGRSPPAAAATKWHLGNSPSGLSVVQLHVLKNTNSKGIISTGTTHCVQPFPSYGLSTHLLVGETAKPNDTIADQHAQDRYHCHPSVYTSTPNGPHCVYIRPTAIPTMHKLMASFPWVSKECVFTLQA